MTGLRAGVVGVVDRLQAAPRADPPPPPILESFADSLYDAVAPLAWLDYTVGFALAYYCGALGAMFQAVDSVARDTPEGPGWSAVVDLERCPDAWLPWLGQFIGVTVPPGATPAEQRAWIAGTDGFKRGTPDAIRTAAGLHLTNSRTVFLTERFGGDAYALAVRTLTTETPDTAQTLADIIAAKPAGIVLDYATTPGPTYDIVKVTLATYTALRASAATYDEMRSTMP